MAAGSGHYLQLRGISLRGSHSISERPLDSGRVSVGAAFGNIWEAWYLIDQTPSSPLAALWGFIKAAITTGGLPTALRLRGRFHKSLCEAPRVHVRGSTCLSPVTRTHRVNCFLGDKHGSDDSWVFRVRGPFTVSHVSAAQNKPSTSDERPVAQTKAV